MKRHSNRALGLIVVLLAVCPVLVLAQTAPATSVNGYPGAGALQAGDLWESFLPQAFGPYYGEGGTAATEGLRQFIRMGNFDRGWTTPNGHWPRAFPWTMYWSHYMVAMAYDPDTTFNPTKKGVAAPATGNWGQVTYKSTLPGASDPARYYSRDPYFVDSRRQHVVYEAGWPTNIGCDVKMRAHAWGGPNWGHFNDFVIVEIEFKNTGNLDMNLDGTIDKSGNNIKALAMNMAGEIFMSISSYNGGGRNVNSISTGFTRMGGMIMDPDPDGNPWAFSAYFPGTKNQTPAAGEFNMGFNAPTLGQYTDTWNGWVWLGIKDGGLPATPDVSTSTLPTKNTIFGTDPVGVGTQRGWYVSAGSGGGLGQSFSNPKQMFRISTGVFHKDGGRSRSIAGLDDSPNPDFFASGTPGDVTTWVAKATPAQPSGDQKGTGFTAGPWEDGKADATTNYPTGWGKWSQGYVFNHDFNGDNNSGVGPVAINNGSSVTFVIALVGGYRLEGIQKAVRAARYTYANNFVVPVLPAVPEMKVTNTLTKSVAVEWNNAAEADAEFQGYKIWKASQFKKFKWLENGIRLADRYQEQMTPGGDMTSYKKPVNPKFDAFAEVNSGSLKGEYQPDTWGTWELVAVIPKAQLAQYAGATPGYNYTYEDKDVVLGFSYWYYVSAYKEGTYTGPGGETTNRIETTGLNMNGADGLWHKTFPFAYVNCQLPERRGGQESDRQCAGGVFSPCTGGRRRKCRCAAESV